MKVSYVFLVLSFLLFYHVLPSLSLSLYFFHPNQLLYWKVVDVYYETQKKHTNKLCGQNIGCLMLNLVVIKVTTYL
jgi:hypothetical protein